MKSLIDTVFKPLLTWLNLVYTNISELKVPVSRPLDISLYLGPFAYLGPYWIAFIGTVCLLAFIYVVTFIIIAQQGIIIKFKDTVKWW